MWIVVQGPEGLHGLTQQQPALHNRVDPALAFTLDTANAVAFLQSQGAVSVTSAALPKCVVGRVDDGSTSCTVGQEASFTIALRDESNQPVTDVTVGTQLQVAWLDAAGKVNQQDVELSRLTVAAVPDHPDQWRVSYCWPEVAHPRAAVAAAAAAGADQGQSVVGPHRLSITLLDQHLPRSPLTIRVHPKCAPAKCVVSASDGSALCTVANEASFTIILRDESNQPVTDASVGAQLRVVWLDATGQASQRDVATSRLTVTGVPGHVEKWQVKYCWPDGTTAGSRRLSVKLMEQELPRCPLSIQVQVPAPVPAPVRGIS